MIVLALLLSLPSLAPAAPVSLSAERALTAPALRPRVSIDTILDALRATESGGYGDGGRHATGDGGRAIGPYQIHRAYFHDSGVVGRYADCRDPDYSRRVVLAYWRRWCPEALERGDAEVLARVHNGGPNGAQKSDTLAYWRRVQGVLAGAPTRSRPAQH